MNDDSLQLAIITALGAADRQSGNKTDGGGGTGEDIRLLSVRHDFAHVGLRDDVFTVHSLCNRAPL